MPGRRRRRRRRAGAIALGATLLAALPAGATASAAQSAGAPQYDPPCVYEHATFITGFSGDVGDGVHKLGTDLVGQGVLAPDGLRSRVWTEGPDGAPGPGGGSEVITGDIESYHARCPGAKIVLVGHSYGGDAAFETAAALAERQIPVDLLVQIDSVRDITDPYVETLPPNVRRGINMFATLPDGIRSTTTVDGSENIAIEGVDHDDIDNGIGVSHQPGFENKSTHTIVREAIEAL